MEGNNVSQGMTVRVFALLGLWTLISLWLARGIIANYFPIADDWALMAAARTDVNSAWDWITKGFSGYFVYYPELMKPYANFLRPFFNFSYWLQGQVLAPDNGARLLLNCLAVSAASGLAYYAMITGGAKPRIALALAAALPLMCGFLPALSLITPCMAYDPLVACVALGIYIAEQQKRSWLTLLLLTVGLGLKETVLPVAVAVPLCRVLAAPRQRSAWLGAALMTLPLLLWAASRGVAFAGSVAGGTYAFDGGLRSTVKAILRHAQLQPFWHNVPVMPEAWSRPIRLSANALIMPGLALLLFADLRKRRWPNLAVMVAIISYAFLLLTGVFARLSAVFDAFLMLSIALWLSRADRPRLASRLTVAGLLIGLAGNAVVVAATYGPVTGVFQNLQDVGRSYVQHLRGIPPGRRVLMLNDPITFHSRASALTEVMDIPLDLGKVSSYACWGAVGRIEKPCSVSLEKLGERQYRFTQSCGLDICQAKAKAIVETVQITPEARIELQPTVKQGALPVWDSFVLTLDRGDLDLLYFDPADRSFRSVAVP